MKTIAVILGAAFLVIAGVLFSLIRNGGALKPAGVIKPAEIGADPALIGTQIAVRLYPDFDAAKFVVWRVEGNDEALNQIPRSTFAHDRVRAKPTLVDLRTQEQATNCEENCWYVAGWDQRLPDPIAAKIKDAPTVEIYVQYFDRSEQVPPSCEAEKILDVNCMRPVSVREVRRKLKTPARHFFMQRYQASQFYLYLER